MIYKIHVDLRKGVTASCNSHSECHEAKKVQRLHAARSMDTRDQGKRTPVPSILVVLDGVDEQRRVLQAARHHTSKEFSGIFAHEDRTQAQQLQYSECARQAKDRNAALQGSGLLVQPFRYVVRGDRVRCINSVESAQHKKSMYVSELLIKEYLDGLKRVNNGISRQSVSKRPNPTDLAKTSATAEATQH